MIPSDIQIQPLLHYAADSATAEWLAAMREMETECERAPAQRTYHGEPLVNLAGVVLVPASRVAELLGESPARSALDAARAALTKAEG